jgi:hypothetical protein
MKSKKIFAVIILIMAISAIGVYYSVAYSNSIASSSVMKSADSVYTCPMHPEITSDKPGQCPKCGMDLVLKTDDNSDKNMGMKNCMDKDKCKEMGCNMDNCKGETGGCKEGCCKMMKDKDMKKDGNMMDHKNMKDGKCESDCKSGCMGK